MFTTVKRVKRVNHNTAPAAIEAREPFANSTGNLSGRWHEPWLPPRSGWLDGYEAGVLHDHTGEQRAFVVYSFETPIAWWTEEHGWYKVKQRFSMTTSTKHQSRLYLV